MEPELPADFRPELALWKMQLGDDEIGSIAMELEASVRAAYLAERRDTAPAAYALLH